MFARQKNNPQPERVHPKLNKGRRGGFLLLVGLSILSALVILSFWLLPIGLAANGFVPKGFDGALPGLVLELVIFWVIIAQCICVIPASLAVFLIYRPLARRWALREHNLAQRLGIPLLFNALAAGWFILLSLGPVWYGNLDAIVLSRNLTLTTRNEKIVQGGGTGPTGWYLYQADVHAENNTDQTLVLIFNLGDYTTGPTQYLNNPTHTFGDISSATLDEDDLRVPPGELNFTVTVPFDEKYSDVYCDKNMLAKPLHFLYTIRHTTQSALQIDLITGSLPVDQSVNQDMLQLVCSGQPPN